MPLHLVRALADAADAHFAEPALERQVLGPASVAVILAMEASIRNGSPFSALEAASRTCQRAARISISLSTSIHWIDWREASGAPNVSRIFAYSVAISCALIATPMQAAE